MLAAFKIKTTADLFTGKDAYNAKAFVLKICPSTNPEASCRFQCSATLPRMSDTDAQGTCPVFHTDAKPEQLPVVAGVQSKNDNPLGLTPAYGVTVPASMGEVPCDPRCRKQTWVHSRNTDTAEERLIPARSN